MKKRSNSRQRKLTFKQREEIIKKHFDKKVSQSRLAEEYEVSREMIGRYCRRNGRSPVNNLSHLNTQEIVKLYVEEKKSVLQIAKIFGVTTRPINKRLKEAGVIKRPISLREQLSKTVPHYWLRMKIWTAKVIERDNMICKWCDAENTFKNRLEAHHIIAVRYLTEENWHLIFELSNGITLCRKCHTKTMYREKELETFFLEMLQKSN